MARSLAAARSRTDQLAAGIVRRRDQISRSEDFPWPWYDLAKFSLVLGDDQAGLHALMQAAVTSTHVRQVDRSVSSLRRIAVPDAPPAWDGAIGVGGLGAAALFSIGTPGPPAVPLRGPVVILAGASMASLHDAVMKWREPLSAALPAEHGTLVSGGTSHGVSALAAAIAAGRPGWRSVGYLPEDLPAGTAADTSYDELRRTDSDDFSLAEPLAYWSDLIGSGIAPGEVHVLGIGGGPLTRLELHLAAMVGAKVGIAAVDGTVPPVRTVDPLWPGEVDLPRLSAEVDTLRAWLGS